MNPADTPSEHSNRMRLVMSLWVKHQPTISTYIGSVVRDRHHAEDLTQEVASVVASKIDAYDPDLPFLPWTLGIARNLILKYLRTQRRDRHVFDEQLLTGLARAHEARADHASARKAALERCLKHLPDKSRALLRARYFDGRSVKQIASDRGKTEGAVSMVLFRLRHRLAECIRTCLSSSEGV